nr:uncharacterized protein LOC113738378 [Coffea arabica]
MALNSSMRAAVATLVLFSIVLTLPCEATRPTPELIRRPPIVCPACVCCAPAPPGSCCPCRCPPGVGSPIGYAAEADNTSP